MNYPSRFKVHRTVAGDGSGEKKYLPLRKSIVDVTLRTQVCSQLINDFTEKVVPLEEYLTVGEILAMVGKPVTSKGKRCSTLDVTGKDMELLRAIADPKYSVDAITNKHLQATL